ncbi:hypothetical protein GCM10023307_30260 [Lysobacter hankyongensis]|uniref:Uncharacterized protein n=1 Tax=Lysobacter hankyongensis TaxID=1176535 RepID=A0ABP9BYW8_9GAMM
MNGGNQFSAGAKFGYQQDCKVRTNSYVLDNLQHRQIICPTWVRRKRWVRMPFADVIESSVVVPRLPKESMNLPDGILNPPNEGRECTTTMHGHLPDNKQIRPDMFTH